MYCAGTINRHTSPLPSGDIGIASVFERPLERHNIMSIFRLTHQQCCQCHLPPTIIRSVLHANRTPHQITCTSTSCLIYQVYYVTDTVYIYLEVYVTTEVRDRNGEL